VRQGVLYGAGAVLFGQGAGPVPPDPQNWYAAGGVGAAAIGAIVWLIRHFTAEIKEVTAKFEAAVAKKDQQILDLTARLDATVKDVAARFEALMREVRAENAETHERMYVMSREMVAAIEHASAGLQDVKTALQSLSSRVDAIEPRKPPRGS
jgi:methyl-accepting chemotaxis protein